jgi:hypothetical protein
MAPYCGTYTGNGITAFACSIVPFDKEFVMKDMDSTPSIPITTTVPSSTSPKSVTSSPSSTGDDSSTTTSATPTTTSQPTSSSKPPIGAIVGGVVGGLAVIVGGVVALFWIRNSKSKGPDPAVQQQTVQMPVKPPMGPTYNTYAPQPHQMYPAPAEAPGHMPGHMPGHVPEAYHERPADGRY